MLRITKDEAALLRKNGHKDCVKRVGATYRAYYMVEDRNALRFLRGWFKENVSEKNFGKDRKKT